MEQIKLDFNKIHKYKQYGNKHMLYWINTITREEYFLAQVCGERKKFEYSVNGCNEMEKWINKRRHEIGVALKLLEDNDDNA